MLPGAVPNIFAGFRIALPYAIGAAVIAELISSNRGLGYLVQIGAMNFDTTQVLRRDLAATIIVYAVGWLVDGTERFLLRWRPPGDVALQPAATERAMNATPLLEIRNLAKRFPHARRAASRRPGSSAT